MAMSNWDCLAYTLRGPSRNGRVTNGRGQTVEIRKNWLNVTEARTTARGVWPRRQHAVSHRPRARVTEGNLSVGDWYIVARRGPQDGIYVIAYSAAWDLEHDCYVDKALLVGCGVAGYTNPEEQYIAEAIDLGVDPDSLMITSTLDDDGEDERSVVGLYAGDDGSKGLVTVATDVPDSEWVGVLPDSVGYLKAMVADCQRDMYPSGWWPGRELSDIPWDAALRFNQGDLFFDEHIDGVPDTATVPGEADEPLIMQFLKEE